jgi:hypothetical protein
LIVGTAAVATSASTAASSGTVVHFFHAFQDGKIAPGVHVKQTARGYCWETSAVESRPYAWRCLKGNYILDPCFSPARHGHTVLCPIEPWSRQVLRLQLTRSLPTWQSNGYNQSLPVGIWTTTGKRCVHGSGATTAIHFKPITYACGGGGVLVGLAKRSTATWTIWYASSYKAHVVTRVGIADAWW